MKFIRTFLSAFVFILVFASGAVGQAPNPEQLIIKDWCVLPLLLEFSPNGGELARGCIGYGIAFFDTGNYRIAHTFLSELEYTPDLRAFSYSPDGTMIATARGRAGARVWSVADPGKEPKDALTFSVKEKSGESKGDLYAWDTPLRILQPHVRGDDKGSVSAIRFSPDGKLLLTVNTNQVKVWNTSTWTIEKELLSDQDQRPEGVLFSPDGKRLLAWFGNGQNRVWNVGSWTVVGEFTAGNREPNAVAFAPDSQTVMMADDDGVLHQWSLQTKREVWNLHTFEGAGNKELCELSFSPDGKTMVATSLLGAKPVIVWNTTDWKAQTQSGYGAAAFSKDGKFLALAGIDHIKLVDPDSLKELRDIALTELTWDEAPTWY